MSQQGSSASASDSLTIKASDGSGEFTAYLAQPASGAGPGLVIAQEIFGVNANLRQIADEYAEAGYMVLVPDLFWRQQPGVQLGYTPEDWQRAFQFYQGFDEDLGVEDLQATINALRALPGCTGDVGVMGFCLGGKLAYLAACRTDTDVAIAYYGVGIEDALEEADHIGCRLLMHIAGLDKYCPPAAQQKIIKALGQHQGIEVHVYPDADHAFARPAGEHFDADVAKLAEQRSLDALHATIGP